MTEREIIDRALSVTTALLDSGLCPDCLGGECHTCQGFGQDSNGIECADCEGQGDAPHLPDCGLVVLHHLAYDFIYGVTHE